MAFRTSSPTGDPYAPQPQLREASVPVAREVCKIERWRGYVSSTFFARLEDGTALYESKPFRARGKGPLAKEGPAAQAYAGLVAALEELGWQRVLDGDGPWYSTQFFRLVATPTVAAAPIVPQRPVDILNLATHRIEAIPEQVEVMPGPLDLRPHPIEAIPRRVEVVQAEAEVVQPQAEVETSPAPAETPPAKDVARVRRRPRKLTLVSAAGALIAVGAVALNMAGFGKHSPTLRKAVPQAGAAAQKAQTPAAKPAHAATPPAATPKARPPAATPTPKVQTPAATPTHATLPALRISIRATNVGSWLEIRRQSSSGPVVFSGLLPGGRTLHLTGARFWASIGAAGNLAIAVNGGRVNLQGTLEHTFSPPGH